MKSAITLVTCVLALPALAQNTCYTSPPGATICSTPDAVIHGNSNSSGSSIYRDDRGNRLKFSADPSGNATVQPISGKPIRWSQAVLGTLRYPPLTPQRELPGATSPSVITDPIRPTISSPLSSQAPGTVGR